MEKRTSPVARIFAALALVAAVLAVVVVVSAGTGDDSRKGGNGSGTVVQKQKNRERTEAKVYVVKSGDTLTAIAQKTGVPVNEIRALNPEVDPQILIAGQELKLR